MKQYGEMQLISCMPPRIDGGDYRMTVRQIISEPQETELYGTQLRFHTGESRFTLDPELVCEVYPPPGMSADYGRTLPHLVLKRPSLPWSREPDSGRTLRGGAKEINRMPWLALLLFDEEEEPEIRSVTLQELMDGTEGIYFPLTGQGLGTGENPEDRCEVIDIAPELFRRIMPGREEIPWLAHVRVADLSDRQDDLISHPGYFGVVVCSRIPKTEMNMRRSIMHLVSIEGFASCLPGGDESAWADAQAVRMVSLYHWEFCSGRQTEESFFTLARQLDVGMLRPELPRDTGTETGVLMHVQERMKKGYIVLDHIVRTGEKTASWYRGPLIPQAPDQEEKISAQGADGRVMYDTDTRLFDMSYAAAWQLGRLLMLEDRAAATELCRWRRNVGYEERVKAERRIILSHLEAFRDDSSENKDGADSFAGEEENTDIKETVFRGLAGRLGSLLLGTDEEESVSGVGKADACDRMDDRERS